jgi:hypothetical protein
MQLHLNLKWRSILHLHQIGIASPVATMDAFMEKYRPWIESVTGCSNADTLTLECNFPFSHVVLEQLLSEVHLDRQCLTAAEALRPMVKHWETPPECSPRIEIVPSRDQRAQVTQRKLAWDPHWKETPIAIWLNGAEHAIVSASIPYVSYVEKGALSWRQWTIVNRREAAFCLTLLRQLEAPRSITVIGGPDIRLPDDGYNWDSVLLDPSRNEMVRHDYEAFWESEGWFSERRLQYKRGFLLYGPPGNGKTSVARIMACHPQVSAFSIDLTQGLPNDALSDLFQAAGHNTPALIILEDLDHAFGSDARNEPQMTLSYFLNCLDGITWQNGIVIVATANDPTTLDAAILRRPGRFDRLVPFPPPSVELRSRYISSLSNRSLHEDSAPLLAVESDRLSFAQIREAYILAGQRAFRSGDEIGAKEILEAIRLVRGEINQVVSRGDSRTVGFGNHIAPEENGRDI